MLAIHPAQCPLPFGNLRRALLRPTPWLNLQSSFDLKQAESETGKRIELEVRPMEMVA
jgi:hypothetical protein